MSTLGVYKQPAVKERIRQQTCVSAVVLSIYILQRIRILHKKSILSIVYLPIILQQGFNK